MNRAELEQTVRRHPGGRSLPWQRVQHMQLITRV